MASGGLEWLAESGEAVAPGTIPTEEVYGLVLDGEEFTERDDALFVWEDRLTRFPTDQLPVGLWITPCSDYYDWGVIPGDIEGEICWNGRELVVRTENACVISKRTGDYDPLQLGQIKAEIEYLTALAATDDRVDPPDSYESGEQTGYTCEVRIPGIQPIDEALEQFHRLNRDMLAQTETVTGSRLFDSATTWASEEAFTLQFVIPLLKAMGMRNVRYIHGNREFGKDVLFEYDDALGRVRYGAAQAKLGDVSGDAKSDMLTLTNQIHDSFTMPYASLSARGDVYISQLFVVISGSYKGNAPDKLLQGVKPPVSSCVSFIDGTDLRDLHDEYGQWMTPAAPTARRSEGDLS